MSIEHQIKQKLEKHGISTENWGVGKAKTLEHLVKEVLAGETHLVESGNELLRRVEFVHVEVYFSKDGVTFQLIEDRQEFSDGRTRRRGLSGVSEKMSPNENVMNAITRALREELGVTHSTDIEYIGREDETIDSPSYPGLKTEYKKHEGSVNLSERDFNPSGYIEVQKDKKTFFVWKQI